MQKLISLQQNKLIKIKQTITTKTVNNDHLHRCAKYSQRLRVGS